MELDALKALSMYWNDLPGDDRKVPGDDAKFDAKFAAWLQEKSGWVPLRVLLDAKPELLERAGYPSRQVDGLPATPSRPWSRPRRRRPAPCPRRPRLASSPRPSELGEAVNKVTYPSPEAMAPRGLLQRGEPVLERASTPTAWR